MKILLVDDSKTMRTIQKRVLETMQPGTEIFEAADGFEALSVLSSIGGKVDLALIDWNMPNMDGLTLVQRLREKDKVTPLVMCTTESEKERVVAAAKAGISGYIIKPFDGKTLIEKVQAVLAKSKAA